MRDGLPLIITSIYLRFFFCGLGTAWSSPMFFRFLLPKRKGLRLENQIIYNSKIWYYSLYFHTPQGSNSECKYCKIVRMMDNNRKWNKNAVCGYLRTLQINSHKKNGKEQTFHCNNYSLNPACHERICYSVCRNNKPRKQKIRSETGHTIPRIINNNIMIGWKQSK
jgi:hypothetical protein